MNINVNPLKALLTLVTAVATAWLVYRLGWDGTEIEWWVALVFFLVILVGVGAIIGAHQLTLIGRNWEGVLLALVTGGVYVIVYFVTEDEIPGNAGWALLVSGLIAVNIAVSSTSVE